jgi:hypothetical protein
VVQSSQQSEPNVQSSIVKMMRTSCRHGCGAAKHPSYAGACATNQPAMLEASKGELTMRLQVIIRTVIDRVWFKLPRRNRENHEFAQLLHYHPFLFGRTRS